MPVKIGLAALCAHWFQEVGLQGENGGLAETLRRDYARIVDCLAEQFIVIAPGVISTVEDASRAVARFREEQVDALLLVHIFWSEDQPLIEMLRNGSDWPLLLWDYHPIGALPPHLSVNDLFRCSGTVGMLQGSAPMQRLGVRATLISGTPGDPELAHSLQTYAAALRIRQAFQGMKVGRIAGRCEVMTGTHADPETLRTQLGVTLQEFTAAEYADYCTHVDPARVDAWAARLTSACAMHEVAPESLRLACRNALAIDDLVVEHELSVVAMQDLDPELHAMAGIRPCLCPPECARRGVALVMESDVNTGLAMLAAMRAADAPALYTEIFTYDPQAGLLLMGHAAPHDPRLAAVDGVTLVPDAEYRHVDACEGVWQEFILREGPVTCISLYDTGAGYRMVTFDGTSLGAPRRLEGFAHAMVRPAVPVRQLLPRLVQRGLTQHFVVVPGAVSEILAQWCALSNIAFERETAND